MTTRLTQLLTPRARLARTIATLATLACAGMVAAGCGDKDGITDAGSVSTITISPNPQTLAISGTQQFTATGRNVSGASVAITPVWTVVSGGGTINSAGMFTAGQAAGTFTATVKATSGTLSATATVIVTAGPLASITITPTPVSLVVGTTQQFTAVGKDAGGNVVTLTPTWSVGAGGGAVNGTGMFTAGMVAGTFTNTIQVGSGGITATATVTVTAGALATIVVTPNPVTLNAGATQTFTAAGRDASGNTVAITPVWSVANSGGTIATTGLFTAGATPGTFTNTVTATSGGISGTATVIVANGPLATITITSNAASVAVGGTQQFTAVGRDSDGNLVPITPAWSVVAGGGTIDLNSGRFTAGTTTGTFTNTVRATVGTLSGFATVTVTGGSAATITVTPNPALMNAGATQQFTAVARDAGGNVTVITPVWSIENGGGTINPNTGLFTAGAVAGTFTNTVKATAGTISGVASVTVSQPVAVPRLVAIIVTPNPVTLVAGGNQQFTATGRDETGAIFPVFPLWSVVNGGGTMVGVTGFFTAGAAAGTFINTVTATLGALSGTATVTVTTGAPPPPLVNLGSAAPNGIMAGTAVTCVLNGVINADVSIAPGNTVTGFGPCIIRGVQHLNDGIAVQGQIDLTTAYNTLAGLPCPPANAIVANLGGTTKPAGVYCTASGIGVTGTLTLNGGGDPNATFVFQAGSSLTTAGNIVLINGAQAKNVYWQVGSSATIGTASQWQGNILALTSITLVDNATLFGRALARNGAVSLGTNNLITLP